ncbi:glycosyltransferase family 4 protein [Bacteroidota bacterium]
MTKKVMLIGPALTMGGMQRATANFAELLQESGFEVRLVLLVKRPHFFKIPSAISILEPEGFNLKGMDKWKTVAWLRMLMKQEKPELILVIQKFGASLASIASWGLKIPLVISERSSPHFQWGWVLDTWMKIAFLLKKPNLCLAQTRYAAGFQQAYYSPKTRVEVFPNILREVKSYPHVMREPYVLAIGRFGDYLKGFDRLLRAFARVGNKDWKLVFAGGEFSNWEYAPLAEELGIVNRLIFTGKLEDTDEWMARASVFVIPSRSEGFPNALTEAMAAGLAVISFDFKAGPSEIITHLEDGILVKEGDIDALAEQLHYLIEDKKMRIQLGEKARITSQRYSPKVLGHQLKNLLNELTR